MSEAERIGGNDIENTPWHRWGPYVSERQWGTVREDYSPHGTAWEYFSHDQARSRAYRWGEDGIAGWSDRHGLLNVGFALWNGVDPILKERFFGLTNSEGNHGEDVKECYWYLDATPTHSYGRMLYKYPQRAYPYDELIQRNREAGREGPEIELVDTAAFDDDRYFDVVFEVAKADLQTSVFRVTIHNRGPEAAPVWFLPQVWFRNTWSWKDGSPRPEMTLKDDCLGIDHPRYGGMIFRVDGTGEWLFTENETGRKDAFHRALIHGEKDAVNPQSSGSKAGVVLYSIVPSGGSIVFRYSLWPEGTPEIDVDETMTTRRREADEFYGDLAPGLPPEVALVQRQAFAGLLWSKQFYHYDVNQWLNGDPAQPMPPVGRNRNEDWRNVHTAEVMSVPDKWEFPWFAAWDLAFHTIPFALIDPRFAKDQLILLMREWFQHPSGQIPAYEWSLSDVNPPVHAWAVLRVYQIDGRRDQTFLKRAFHKLLLNFTWWVNRKDVQGNNIFEGGFLGLDNIGVFDRNQNLPEGYLLEQSDATSWMAMFCLNMMDIALELATFDAAYEDVASKFFEHFMYVSTALNHPDSGGIELWNEEDGFYYDALRRADGTCEASRVHSFVGLIPLFAVTTIEPEIVARFDGFRRRMRWFLDNRSDLTCNVASMETPGEGQRLLLSAVTESRLRRVLERVLAPEEFLSDHGIRSVSKFHERQPFSIQLGDETYTIGYEPGESKGDAFGGNSNWRGPVWFPVNYLLIESLQRFDHYFGGELTIDAGEKFTLANVAADLEERLLKLFLRDEHGRRPCNGGKDKLDFDPHWKDLVAFNEYFHGDTGKGLGASHQTGWTAIVAKIIQQLYVTAPHTRTESPSD